jgi:hypothetical protein
MSATMRTVLFLYRLTVVDLSGTTLRLQSNPARVLSHNTIGSYWSFA